MFKSENPNFESELRGVYKTSHNIHTTEFGFYPAKIENKNRLARRNREQKKLSCDNVSNAHSNDFKHNGG